MIYNFHVCLASYCTLSKLYSIYSNLLRCRLKANCIKQLYIIQSKNVIGKEFDRIIIEFGISIPARPSPLISYILG